jgi:hypothetical protein
MECRFKITWNYNYCNYSGICRKEGEEMDVTTLLTLISGVGGAATGVTALIVGIRKQNNDDRRTGSDIAVDTATVAGSMVKTAGEIQDMYKESLQECKDEINGIKEDTSREIESLKSQIRALQNTIDTMNLRDKDRINLIKKLIRGINTLIKQIQDCHMIPQWIPSEKDINLDVS